MMAWSVHCIIIMETLMLRTVCRECKQVIRRPVDHIFCPGATDNWFLDTVEYTPSDRATTREYQVPGNNNEKIIPERKKQ
jgi:hypothetical protein